MKDAVWDLNNNNNSLMQINIHKRFNLDKLETRNKLNSNNSVMQINIIKRSSLDKLEKRNKLLFRKLKLILDGDNINMIN